MTGPTAILLALRLLREGSALVLPLLAALGVLAVFALAYFVWPTKTGPPRK